MSPYPYSNDLGKNPPQSVTFKKKHPLNGISTPAWDKIKQPKLSEEEKANLVKAFNDYAEPWGWKPAPIVGSFSQKEIWLTLEVDGKKFGSKALLPDLWEHTNKQMRTKQLIEMLRLLEHQLENEIMKEVNK
jgi:hypothetical protein